MGQINDGEIEFWKMFMPLIEKADVEEDFRVDISSEKYAEVFLNEMNKNGFIISSTYVSLIKDVSKDSTKRNDDIGVLSNHTEEELQVINELNEAKFYENSDNLEKGKAFGNFMFRVIGTTILKSKDKDFDQEL